MNLAPFLEDVNCLPLDFWVNFPQNLHPNGTLKIVPHVLWKQLVAGKSATATMTFAYSSVTTTTIPPGTNTASLLYGTYNGNASFTATTQMVIKFSGGRLRVIFPAPALISATAGATTPAPDGRGLATVGSYTQTFGDTTHTGTYVIGPPVLPAGVLSLIRANDNTLRLAAFLNLTCELSFIQDGTTNLAAPLFDSQAIGAFVTGTAADWAAGTGPTLYGATNMTDLEMLGVPGQFCTSASGMPINSSNTDSAGYSTTTTKTVSMSGTWTWDD